MTGMNFGGPGYPGRDPFLFWMLVTLAFGFVVVVVVCSHLK